MGKTRDLQENQRYQGNISWKDGLNKEQKQYGPNNGTPLQYSCLENPMDGGAWKAAVHGVAEGWTRLKQLISSSRDLFKKIRDTKETFHAKMDTIKDRNGMDLIEAEDIKRWQEYTEELYKKDLHGPDNHDGVITHLEPDILECPGCEAK